MPLHSLDHVFVRANDLEATKDFYCDVLGFEVMPRPAFPFAGYWLGVDGRVQIHMGQHGIEHWDRFYVGTTERSATDQAGVVDHVAFEASDPEELHRRCIAAGVQVTTRWFAAIGLGQMFLADPNGVFIELNFRDLAAEPKW